MASTNTNIQWTDATWNAVVGCSPASPGCTNCYAMSYAHQRLSHLMKYDRTTDAVNDNAVWTGVVRLWEPSLREPFGWRAPRKIFVNSMSDLFHEKLSDTAIARVWAVMALTGRHTYQVLTKRADRMQRWINDPATPGLVEAEMRQYDLTAKLTWPLENVWVGISVEDQKRARERIPLLLRSQAAIRFISAEPLLERVELRAALGVSGGAAGSGTLKEMGLDWVIVGGESGSKARPMHPDWARSLRDECAAEGIAFFFKQRGEWCWEAVRKGAEAIGLMPDGTMVAPGTPGAATLRKVGTRASGTLLDGWAHLAFP
jgi:protein gp37